MYYRVKCKPTNKSVGVVVDIQYNPRKDLGLILRKNTS